MLSDVQSQALEKYCRTSSGYTGVKNVYQDYPVKDDVQQSFFIAETLKVSLILLFLLHYSLDKSLFYRKAFSK